jgi:hypothetical protein
MNNIQIQKYYTEIKLLFGHLFKKFHISFKNLVVHSHKILIFKLICTLIKADIQAVIASSILLNWIEISISLL